MAKTENRFIVHVRDLMHAPGEMREATLEIPAPADLRNAVIGVAPGSDIRVDLRLESVHEGILATADVAADIEGECVRCLTPLRETERVEFQELFAYSAEGDSELEVHDETADLEQPLRDAVVTALPFQPVCREDCAGLCPECGVRLDDHPCHAHEAPVDPRFAGLAGLLEDPTE